MSSKIASNADVAVMSMNMTILGFTKMSRNNGISTEQLLEDLVYIRRQVTHILSEQLHDVAACEFSDQPDNYTPAPASAAAVAPKPAAAAAVSAAQAPKPVPVPAAAPAAAAPVAAPAVAKPVPAPVVVKPQPPPVPPRPVLPKPLTVTPSVAKPVKSEPPKVAVAAAAAAAASDSDSEPLGVKFKVSAVKVPETKAAEAKGPETLETMEARKVALEAIKIKTSDQRRELDNLKRRISRKRKRDTASEKRDAAIAVITGKPKAAAAPAAAAAAAAPMSPFSATVAAIADATAVPMSPVAAAAAAAEEDVVVPAPKKRKTKKTKKRGPMLTEDTLSSDSEDEAIEAKLQAQAEKEGISMSQDSFLEPNPLADALLPGVVPKSDPFVKACACAECKKVGKHTLCLVCLHGTCSSGCATKHYGSKTCRAIAEIDYNSRCDELCKLLLIAEKQRMIPPPINFEPFVVHPDEHGKCNTCKKTVDTTRGYTTCPVCELRVVCSEACLKEHNYTSLCMATAANELVKVQARMRATAMGLTASGIKASIDPEAARIFAEADAARAAKATEKKAAIAKASEAIDSAASAAASTVAPVVTVAVTSSAAAPVAPKRKRIQPTGAAAASSVGAL